MATGDALDQVLAEIDAQSKERAQRRVPAPQPAPVSPSVGTQAGVAGRPASTTAPTSRGGPTFMDNFRGAATHVLDQLIPGAGTLLGLAASHPEGVKGIAAGVLRSPVTAAAGLADFGGDVAHAVAGPRADPRSYQAKISRSGLQFRYDPTGETYSSFARNLTPLGHAGDQTANEVSSNIASLAVGYGAGASLARFAGAAPKIEQVVQSFGNPVARSAASLAVRAGGGGAVDAMLMDPETERFSNILQNLGVHTEFTDWLAHKDGEGKLEGRFKNAVEGTGLGAAADGVFQAARYWRARLTGDHAAADAIQGELAAKHEGEVPDYIIDEHPGAPPVDPKAPEPGYVGGWEDTETGAVRPVYEEDPSKGATPAQAAEAADNGTPRGASPEVPEFPPAQPGGSTGGPVRPMDPKAMAKAMGDPEAAGESVTFTAKLTPEDTPRVVGSMDRGELGALAHDVEMWRGARDANGERALDVTHPSPAAAAHGEFRLGNLGGSQENVAPMIRAMVDRIPETAKRTDAELMADVVRGANELGEDPATLREAARLISGKVADADTSMATLVVLNTRAARALDALPDINWETASQQNVDQFAEAIHHQMLLATPLQEAKAGLGRGLRVNQLPDADSYLNTVRKATTAEPPLGNVEVGPLPRTRPELQTWKDAWDATKGDPQLRADFLEGALTRSVPSPGSYLRRSFPNFFTAAVLSAPRTHLLGFTGPTLMSILRNTERLSGGYMASLNPFISESQRQAALIAARQTSFNYVSTLQDATDALHWAAKAGAENKSQLHSGITFDSARSTGPVNPSLIQAAGYNPGDLRYKLGNAINLFPRAIARLYNYTDELTQRLAYYNEVRANATIEGAQQGLDGDVLHEFVRTKLKASTNQDPGAGDVGGAATDQDALASAQRNSFLGPVGTEGGWVRRVADGINGMRRDYPELRYVLPVFNVPANILGEIIRRTPLAGVPGFGLGETVNALRGDYGAVAQAEAHGRVLTGGAFLTAGLLLSRAGLLTGAGPQEGTARKVWLQEHQPWSLRVGDSWVRLDRYDTAGGLITIPATVADATQYVKQDEKTGDFIMSSIGALAEWFKDRASMRTAATLFELGDDPTSNTGNTIKRMTASTVAGLIPNVLQTMVTQQMDPTLRRKEAWMDYIKAAVPGLSATLPPVRNVLGEPVNRAADTLGEAVFPVTIAKAVSYKDDPVIDEISRMYHTTGYAAGADPQALGYGFFHPQDVALENGQSLYDAFMQARQTLTLHGLTLRQSLNKLINSPTYNKAVDADSGTKATSRGDLSRGYMLKNTFDAYNKAIKAELAEGSPTANKWLTAAAAKQRDDAYLKDVSAEDLVNNPDYYAAHGINGALYSSKVRQGATGALANALRQR